MAWFYSETSTFAWILSLATSICVIQSEYVVMVRTHFFSNPQSLLADGTCCDFETDGSCAVPGCDNLFTYCLRRTRNGFDENCRTSQTNFDDQPLNFSEPMLLGLPNPLSLQGLTQQWIPANGPVFHLNVSEVDSGFGGVVGLVTRAINNPVGEESGLMSFSYPDPPLRASVGLSFRVVCASGFTGDLCQTNIDDCVGVNCENGVCMDGIDSFTCNCNTGYTGTVCDVDVDECSSNPCGTNGRCMDGVNTFNCSCNPGFTGEFCQTDINECMGVNCSGNGVCSEGINSFMCSCTPGYTGTLCDIDVDECSSNPCGTNGKCVDGVNTLNCTCNPGFAGEFCQTNIELQSSGAQTGPIVGGVLGVLISLILILIIVVAVVLTMRCQGKGDIQGKMAHIDALPGDNPVYDRGNTVVTQSSLPAHLSSSDRADMAGSAPDRVFDNPIYGGNDEETEDMYVDPDANHPAGTGMGSAPYHEFDNPIFSGAPDENACSLLADSSTVNGTAASNGQTMFTNTKRGALVIGNERVYDHVN